ncbi:hypothetical protein EBU99_13755 [bacterium]|nr:hypothetical protein [bacterium]
MITATKPAGIATGCPDVGAYIACLASYNNGTLHGAWVDLEMVEGVYSGLPGYLTDSEWPDFAALLEYIEVRAEFTGRGAASSIKAFELICEDRSATVSADDFWENYCGFYNSGAEYAQDLACDTGAINANMQWPLDCIDWDEAFRALEMNTFRANGGLYVFNNF